MSIADMNQIGQCGENKSEDGGHPSHVDEVVTGDV
jgi:hypothetical protein